MNPASLKKLNIYSIPVGKYFNVNDNKCQLVYAPLSNQFFLSTPDEVEKLDKLALEGNLSDPTLAKLTAHSESSAENVEVSTDTFCTLHLLLNEKCNFHCKYCYSASGRSNAELDMKKISRMLDFFLSKNRKAVKDRTIMFMGGGEPVLSWKILKEATLLAEKKAGENDISLHLAVTTNGSIFNDEIIRFFKEHNFTVQLSFEVLPDVQNEQRGSYDIVARNVVRLTEAGINNYVRATITEKNVNRIPEMVRYCHQHFPLVKKLSCQQVVDPEYFTSIEIVKDFFSNYFKSFMDGEAIAESFGITLRSSSSHLINYSKRERFCYNLVCLTPYGTLTVCPDVSSPNEPDYDKAVFGSINDEVLEIDKDKFNHISGGTIHTLEKCRDCYARWNCGSGCPSSRRVYSQEIFDAICDHYRDMLTHSLIKALAQRYSNSSGRNLFSDIPAKLKKL